MIALQKYHKNAETFLRIAIKTKSYLVNQDAYMELNEDCSEQETKTLNQKKELEAYLLFIEAEKNLEELKKTIVEYKEKI